MEERITLKQWKENYLEGKYNAKDFSTQVSAGWYDWFCSDVALSGRLNKMASIVKKLKDSEKVYVWFKNNCPMVGPLYDDFRIADIENGETLYTIPIDDKRQHFKYEIYGIDNDFRDPLLQTQNKQDVIDFLNIKIKEYEERV